ncbi:MAG: CHAT domain-containing protein [Thermoanaerobaculia bacterium]
MDEVVPTPDQQQLIAELQGIEDPRGRQRWLAHRPELWRPELVGALCARAVALLWEDLDQAEHLSHTARWLAEQIDDDASRARSHRTAANVATRRRDLRAAARDYEAALAAFERLGDSRQAAITRNSALSCLCLLGRFDQAYEWAAAARETFRRLGDRLRLARLEANVGTVLSRQDRFVEALANYRSAYEEFQQVGSPRDVGTSLRNIAVCLQDANDFTAALDAYRQARDYCSDNGLPLLVAEVDYNVAYLYYLRGEFARAIRRFELNRKNCERLDDPLHMALCDLDQSEIYLELNLPAEAARLARRGREGFERLGMGYEVAKCSTNLAIALHRRGAGSEAIELLGEAREIFLRERNPVWPAMIDFYRSRMLQSEGRPGPARRLAADALRAFAHSGLPSREALCEIQLARLDLGDGSAVEARRHGTAALELLRPLGLPALEHQAWMVLGRCEEELGDRSAALAAYRKAEATLERLRIHLQTDELKISFLEDKQQVYESLVWLSLEGGAADGRAVFTAIEKAKSRSLVELLAVRAAEIPAKAGGETELVARLRGLRQELNSIYRRIDRKLAESLSSIRRDPGRPDPGESDPPVGAEGVRRQVDRLREICRRREEDLLRTLRELQVADLEFSSLQQATVVDLDAVIAKIPEDAALVEYFFARGTVYACVVAGGELDIVPVSSASRVRKLHRSLRYQLSKLALGQDYAARFGHRLLGDAVVCLRALHDELLAPLRSRLEVGHLIVVPHDVLHHVPFHALEDGGGYLIDRMSISYAPSASVYYLCRSKSASRCHRNLVLGVADERAPLILREAKAVAEILPEARLLLGDRANESNLRRYAASSRIVHLATHGYFRRDSPMFSAIQLADSRLSLFDLYDLELDADLVVLSGCGTGLSEVTAGEELVGLSRGLLYAGARAVLVTLWDVEDESTTELMRTFYRHFETLGQPARALRRAMREHRDRFPHPYYWAPFILIGEHESKAAAETFSEDS